MVRMHLLFIFESNFPGLDPNNGKIQHVSEYCECGHCALMKLEVENTCCKSKRICVKMPDNVCVTKHPDFSNMINKGS